jgi:hypothetical protein
MEKKITNFLKKIKAHEKFETEASKTFEFAIFQKSSWFPSMNDWDEALKLDNSREQQSVIVPEQTSKTESIIPAIFNSNFKTKVLFVGDTYNGSEEDLLGKMIIAMKLGQDEFVRLQLDNDLLNISDVEKNQENPDISYIKLIDSIETHAPLFVISLGAVVTNLLVGKKEKMSGIHGKFFKLKANSFEFQLMPLFHPDFLLINPNMKRTAWIDLQNIMQSLGKI